MLGRGRGVRPRLWAGLAIVVLAALGATTASAELTQHGNLLLAFNGDISPRALPRHDPAPIAVHLDGRIRAMGGERPPGLRKISIALNRKGRLDATGLALCPVSRLRSTTSKVALAVCRSALVGHGSFASAITFPGAPALPAHGRLLAFNGRQGGRGVILIHLYGTDPLPVTRILVFHLSKGTGRYGTTLTTSLPAAVNRWGYLRRLTLTLSRRYFFHGKPRSYLSATCPTPPGFRDASFPFAHAVFGFADKRVLASTVIRTCRARG